MKNLAKILIISVFLSLASLAFSACFNTSKDDEKTEVCTHPYSFSEYDYDETYHWNRCLCEHKDKEKPNKAKHSVSSATGKCMCGYGIECKVVFKGVGIGEIPSQTVRAGELFTEPTQPEREGYAFDGWRRDYSSAYSEIWNFSENAASQKSMELVAVWTKLYTFTYDLAGGAMPDGINSKQVYREGEEISSPVIPVREKHEFVGWSSSSDKFVQYDFENNKTAVKDVTVYAFWKKYYYINYYHKDEADTVVKSKAYEGMEIELSGNWMYVPKREGFELLGWTTEKDGETVGTADGELKITVSDDISLYGLWIGVKSITYDGTGGAVQRKGGYDYVDGGYSYNVREGATPFEPKAKKEGYTFVKWTADLSEETPFDFSKELESDVTLYAVWTYYTVTVKIYDGQDFLTDFTQISDKKVTAGTNFNASVSEKGILGYEFDGLYDGEQCVSSSLSYVFAMPEKNVTLIAKWRIKEGLKNFEFTSDTKNLCITSVKDKTVTDIVVPDYVTQIAQCAFYGCNSVQNLTTGIIPYVEKDGNYGDFYMLAAAFFDKPFDVETTDLNYSGYYPKGLCKITFTGKKMPAYAFAYLETLTEITFTQNLTEIPARAFISCIMLSSVILPQSVTAIGADAFRGCTKITSIEFPEKLESLGDYAFASCRINAVVIHENIGKIGSYCFDSNGLSSFTFSRQYTWELTYGEESKKFVGLLDINYASTYEKNKHYIWNRK